MKNKLLLFINYLLITFAISGSEYQAIQQALQKIHPAFYQQITPFWNWDENLIPKLAFIDTEQEKMYLFHMSYKEIYYQGTKDWDNKKGTANSVTEIEDEKYVTIVYDSWKNISSLSQQILLLHEIFHLYQHLLEIPFLTSANYYLDSPEGKVLFEIEVELLYKALVRNDLRYLEKAIQVRFYRQSLFPDNNENVFELHEGLAEYTGVAFINHDLKQYFIEKKKNLDFKGLTNSFAYITGPLYSYFLDQISPGWQGNKDWRKGLCLLVANEINPNIEKENIDLTIIKNTLDSCQWEERVANYQKELPDLSFYQSLLNDETEKLYIRNNKLRLFFDPTDEIFAIGENAVLLKKVTLEGEWGSLTVDNGIIRMNDWSAFILPPPCEEENGTIRGNNYILHIEPSYSLIKENNIYSLVRKESIYPR